MTSWNGLIDTDGWVGREQILGTEARSRVHCFTNEIGFILFRFRHNSRLSIHIMRIHRLLYFLSTNQFKIALKG